MSDWEEEYRHYTVRKYRTGSRDNRMHIWVGNGHGIPQFSRTICLKDCWWHRHPVGERIRMMVEKAQAKADKINHDQMYIDHDVEKATME